MADDMLTDPDVDIQPIVMPWTATLLPAERGGGRVKLTVSFSNGLETVYQAYEPPVDADQNWLKRQCLETISRLDALYTYADSLTAGPVDLTPLQDKGTDPAALAQQEFLSALANLNLLTGAVAIAALSDSDPVVTAAKDAVAAAAKKKSDLV